uniref:Protein-lysine N-methyltransferase n=1 Tax=Glossina brevipalpis TaxID=37001 RepID=A0A1A9X292_9MUSC
MEDENLSLSADTLAILNEFLKEKVDREREELEKIRNKNYKDLHFEEDWQLSQFWYSSETKGVFGKIVQQILHAADVSSTHGFHIALLSCPSLYKTIKDIHDTVRIFEYDKRFAAFGDDFVFYDFNEGCNANNLRQFNQQYDLIVADPPFLSEECITKMCKIIEVLLKPSAKVIFCSGVLVEPWLCVSLPVKRCKYQPQHERNLGNEFACYANFDLDDYVTR